MWCWKFDQKTAAQSSGCFCRLNQLASYLSTCLRSAAARLILSDKDRILAQQIAQCKTNVLSSLFPENCFQNQICSLKIFVNGEKKSRIRETKHLSTDADSSTNTIEGQTKNTSKHDFFEKRKKSSKTQKLKNVQNYAKNSDMPFDQRSLIHGGSVVYTMFCWTKNTQKPNFFEKRKKNHPKRKNSKTSRNKP